MLTNTEAIGLGSVFSDPRVHLQIHQALTAERSCSLLLLIRVSFAQIYETPTELIDMSSWHTLSKGIQRVREAGCITGLVGDRFFSVSLSLWWSITISAWDRRQGNVHEAAALMGQSEEIDRGPGPGHKQRSIQKPEKGDQTQRFKTVVF